MAITDNHRMVIKVCELYYKDNLSQKMISAKLGISRSQISRILATARANNIVTIKIDNPYSDETILEKTLIEKFKLKDALVINTEGLSSPSSIVELCKQAALQLDAYIPNQCSVGIMSGKTISELVKSIQNFNKRGLEFIPLIGGMGSDGADWHANIIVKFFADKTSGKYYFLNAPVMVNNIKSKKILMSEPGISKVLKKGMQCEVVIIGVGQVSENSTSVIAGALGLPEIEKLKSLGAVASVCGSYVDKNGNIIENDITNRTIGQTLESIRRAKKIAVADGRSKVEALGAVLSGGHIDILITSLDTARGIINLYK
ncbi:MAG: sugar-binding transcriptional regulator [Thermoanaerobacteraceae bacterium]|nr:sugar-binding transcriptional regulator [Thermoanaerobacteraceae bacterium]